MKFVINFDISQFRPHQHILTRAFSQQIDKLVCVSTRWERFSVDEWHKEQVLGWKCFKKRKECKKYDRQYNWLEPRHQRNKTKNNNHVSAWYRNAAVAHFVEKSHKSVRDRKRRKNRVVWWPPQAACWFFNGRFPLEGTDEIRREMKI